MKRTATILAALAVLLIPSAPPVAAATPYVDQACIAYMKDQKPNLTAAERQDRCTVTADVNSKRLPVSPNIARRSAATTTSGYWGWDVGNVVWKAEVGINFHANWICAVFIGCTQTNWVVDNVDCWTDYAYVVTLYIESCPDHGTRLDSDTVRAGMFYTTGYSLGIYNVSIGQHSYVLFNDPRSLSGIIEGTN